MNSRNADGSLARSRATDDPSGEHLRVDWLRLKAAVVDPTTQLAALPGVMEEICRRMDRRETMGMVYLDLSSEAHLESVYGWETYDRLLAQGSRAVLEVVAPYGDDALLTISGIRGEELMLFLRMDPGPDIEMRLLAVKEKLLETLASRLQVQLDNEGPRALTVHAEFSVLAVDPMVRIERAVYRALDELRAACRKRRERQHHQQLDELQRIVESGDIRVRFQPIVHLGTGSIHGFEALSCGPEGSVFQNPEMLFAFAEETDYIVELERACRHESIRLARELGRGRKLFLNCSARGFTDPELFCRTMVDQAEACGLEPSDIVIEITERVAITAWQEFRRSVAALRLIGFSIAIDDMGAGYSSLQSVAEVQPDYLKVDLSLIRDIHRSPIKRSLLHSVQSIAASIGARIIAEGVEQEEECRTLQGMGIGLAQGFFFAPPGHGLQDRSVHFPPPAPASKAG
ncbi:MAG: EAL domain-containing protein [Acidobacteriota bacterium]